MRLRQLMSNPISIRHISIIMENSTEKVALLAALSKKKLIIPQNKEEDIITIEEKKEEIEDEYQHSLIFKMEDNSEYLINIIHSDIHLLLPYEQIPTLAYSDGVLIILDYFQHSININSPIQYILQESRREKLSSVFMINNLQKALLQGEANAEDIYLNLLDIVDNNINKQTDQIPHVTNKISVILGRIAFGSISNKWSFTIPYFATLYSEKFGIDRHRMEEKLWGDNYYDSQGKCWRSKGQNAKGNPLKRTFVVFILDPILQLIKCIYEEKTNILNRKLKAIGIILDEKEYNEYKGEELVALCLHKWLNIRNSLLGMIILHLPSPKEAQSYRVPYLYNGPINDKYYAGIRDCDPASPLMIYITTFVLKGEELFALGRIFSGTLKLPKTGDEMKVKIIDNENIFRHKDEIHPITKIQILRNNSKIKGQCLEVKEVTCGNLVLLGGISKYLHKRGTITDITGNYAFKKLQYTNFTPVIKVIIDIKHPEHLPKYFEAKKLLSKLVYFCKFITEGDGRNAIAGCTLHDIQIYIQILKEKYMKEYELVIGEPIVIYRETVTRKSPICFSKSANRHNNLWGTCEPLEEEICREIEEGNLRYLENMNNILVDKYNWDAEEVKNIWGLGPEGCGSNMLCNEIEEFKVRGGFLEVKNLIICGFQWVVKEGVLMEERLRGVKYNLVDMIRHSDSIHGGPSQFVPVSRKVFCAGHLAARPRIVEPIYICYILSPIGA